jgi:hypothetical protein
MNTVTPFITAKKMIRMIEAGDIIVDQTYGARFVTGVGRTTSGRFIFYFRPPTIEGDVLSMAKTSGHDTTVIDKEWADCEMTVILGMVSTGAARGPNQ